MRTFANASFKEWQVLPPLSLTPALSRWERENCPPAFPNTEGSDGRKIIERSEYVRSLFPLPQGEGRGEGESNGNSPANKTSQ